MFVNTEKKEVVSYSERILVDSFMYLFFSRRWDCREEEHSKR